MADVVDRGEPLLRSEEAWRKRYSRSRTKLALTVMVPTIFLPLMVVGYLAYREGEQQVALTLFAIFPVAMLLGEVVSHWLTRRRPAVPRETCVLWISRLAASSLLNLSLLLMICSQKMK